jgi:hypothetical protein
MSGCYKDLKACVNPLSWFSKLYRATQQFPKCELSTRCEERRS